LAKTLEDLNDESLMDLVLEQNHQAFSVLVTRRHEMFYAAAYRMMQAREEAEDIVQDGFLKIWQNPKIWKKGQGAKFTTWFYKVIINLCLDKLKKTKNIHIEIDQKISSNNQSQEQMLQELAEQQALEKAISDLPVKQKTALNLCVYEEVSNKEAARIMDINVKALESLLMRAKSGIRAALIREGVIEEGQTG